MKRILNNQWKGVFFALACLLCYTGAQAQRFEESTADNPKWFYIRVRGAGATAGLVITERAGVVTGETLQTELSTGIDQQLWRVEAGETSSPTAKCYRIINKASGKKLDIAYDAGRTKRIAVASETPLTEWRIVNNTNLRAATEPAGGTSGQVYLTQTDSDGDYLLTFAASSGITNDNAKFDFWAYGSFPLICSGNAVAWLRIHNAKTSLSGQCLADVGDAAPQGPFLMVEQAADDHSQQWKIVYANPPADPDRVDFVNRATGRAIGTTTVYDMYYYLQAFTVPEVNEGWRIEALSGALHQIASGSPTAAWFWNAMAMADGEQPPLFYEGSPDKEQGFAWQFSLVEEKTTGIRRPEVSSNIKVYTRDRYIYVEGADSYTITNVCGMRMPHHRPLPAGVYIVNTDNNTIKVLVQ
jgi:hypothetical protein